MLRVQNCDCLHPNADSGGECLYKKTWHWKSTSRYPNVCASKEQKMSSTPSLFRSKWNKFYDYPGHENSLTQKSNETPKFAFRNQIAFCNQILSTSWTLWRNTCAINCGIVANIIVWSRKATTILVHLLKRLIGNVLKVIFTVRFIRGRSTMSTDTFPIVLLRSCGEVTWIFFAWRNSNRPAEDKRSRIEKLKINPEVAFSWN